MNPPKAAPLSSLGEGSHHEILDRAIRNVLESEIGKATIQQLVDGLPLSEVEFDTNIGRGFVGGNHLLHKQHKNLCRGVVEKTQKLYQEFNVDSISVKSELLQSFRMSAPGSRAFRIHLVELVVATIHELAVKIYEMDTGFHTSDSIASFEPPKDDFTFWTWNPSGAPPTLLRHQQYCDYDQYPNGIADGVGYWAESRIFGGVVLFDRRDPAINSDADPEAIYFHPDRRMLTYRIFRLLDSQRDALLSFLLAGDASKSNAKLLPILGSSDNLDRVDPEEPIQITAIYRDLWERKALAKDAVDARLHDVVTSIDYPTQKDWGESLDRALERRDDLMDEQDEYYQKGLDWPSGNPFK